MAFFNFSWLHTEPLICFAPVALVSLFAHLGPFKKQWHCSGKETSRTVRCSWTGAVATALVKSWVPGRSPSAFWFQLSRSLQWRWHVIIPWPMRASKSPSTHISTLTHLNVFQNDTSLFEPVCSHSMTYYCPCYMWMFCLYVYTYM